MFLISNILLSTATILLLGGGIYFSFKLHFPQTQWKKLFRGFFINNKLGITPFNSLMLSLAARIGVGSIAGIALAIYIGGPGTIFWIWIIGIITSINTYCESYLGSKYQIYSNGNYVGGPSYYIEKGLKNKKLAKAYALLIVLAYVIGFMTIQANTITISLTNYYNVNSITVALSIVIMCFLSIYRGINSISNITSKIVPIMGIGYVLLSIIIIFKNIDILPNIIINIVKSAWNIKSFSSSFIPTMIIGIKRGVFSTEAGLGTGAIASSTTYSTDKISLALIQILGTYFTTFIICTSTALIILTSNYNNLIINNINGIELTQYAFSYHLGKYGNIILIMTIVSLAYSTIIAGYYYGESSLKYLNNSKISTFILKIVTTILLFIGSLISSNILWNIVDILVELLAIINMYALLKLNSKIIFDYKNSK